MGISSCRVVNLWNSPIQKGYLCKHYHRQIEKGGRYIFEQLGISGLKVTGTEDQMRPGQISLDHIEWKSMLEGLDDLVLVLFSCVRSMIGVLPSLSSLADFHMKTSSNIRCVLYLDKHGTVIKHVQKRTGYLV